MAAMVVRRLSEATRRALRIRAARHGRSVEAEVRLILDEAVRPQDRLRMGSSLVKLFRPGIELDVRRDPAPAEPARFK